MLRRAIAAAAAVAVTAGAGSATYKQNKHFQEDGIKQFQRASFNQPPKGWTGPVFEPSLDFPCHPPNGKRSYPWETIDFKKEPEKYLEAVLNYCFEGNIETDFVPQNNKVRKWYHAPWMTQTPFGREPLHGLTFERPAPIGYLGKSQKRMLQTWAMGMYNEAGGYTLGQVWAKKYEPTSKPEGHSLKFPNGAVTFKLLFSQANKHDLPFLDGSPSWKATIARKPFDKYGGPSVERTEPKDLHLLQVDIAVRDRRADDTTGWVFGTFMYHDSVKNESPWKRLMPVCLMWGNDPGLDQKKYDEGYRPKESWVNPEAIKALEIPHAKRPYLGWLDRGNGPVDNYISSCLSCHSTANTPRLELTFKTGKKGNIIDKEERIVLFFRNIAAGDPFGFVGDPLDYSLQLAAGADSNDDWREHWLEQQQPKFLSQFLGRGGTEWQRPGPPLSTFPEHKLAARGIILSDYSDKEKSEIVE